MDAASASILFKHFGRTGRSLLQYAHDSYPWIKDASGLETLQQLAQMTREEQQDTAVIVRFLLRRRTPPPPLASYPAHFTNFNFLSVDRMLELLAEHQQEDVAELEKDLTAVRDPEARRLLQQLLEGKRRHLQALSEMRTPVLTE
jgi:rubrerythrin